MNQKKWGVEGSKGSALTELELFQIGSQPLGLV